MVILHGLFGSATNWRRIAEALSDQRQIFCVDLPNHGESPWTEDMSYPAQAVLLADFLCDEVPESPILIGSKNTNCKRSRFLTSMASFKIEVGFPDLEARS